VLNHGSRLVLLVFLCLLSLVSAATVFIPEPADLARLRTGEVIVEKIRMSETGGAARFTMLVKAPAEAVWDIIYSCEKAWTFIDGLKLCERLEDNGVRTLTHQVVKTSWLVPTQDLVFQTVGEPYTRLEFKRISGKPKVMEGSWDFISMPQGLVVIHEIRIVPSMPAPGFIIRQLMSKSMPEMMACIRGLAGGSLSPETVSLDLEPCPVPAQAP